MESIYIILVFIYGLLFGSFFNVVGYRIPNGMSIVKPHSFCPKCKHELKWYELIPVFSFLIQGGKCRKCKSRISFFYPVVELLTGILFVTSYLFFGFSFKFFIALLIAAFLVIVIVSDFNYLVIPNEVTLFFSVTSLVVQAIFDYKIAITSLLYGIILFFVMYFIMIVGNKALHEESLGGGDVKLMFFIGTVVNVIHPIVLNDFSTYIYIANGFFELFLSSCLASPFALTNYFSKKGRGIPFGPFILLAALIMFYLSFDIYSFIKLVWSI